MGGWLERWDWWNRWRERRRRERRPAIALALSLALLRGDDESAREFRRDLDRERSA
jgi:hypothetical protein